MLNEKIFLTQTDTTIGFVSRNAARLTAVKQRPPHKYYIMALPSLKALKSLSRVPSKHKNHIRRARKRTFVMPDGHSYRIVDDPHHLLLLKRLGYAYTTSANLSGEVYDETFAKDAADIIVTPLHTLGHPSSIYKLGKQKLKRIR